MRLSEAPKVGSRWREVSPHFVSARPSDYVIRVMGIVENYVVARRTGAFPFLTAIRDWEKHFVPASRSALDKESDHVE